MKNPFREVLARRDRFIYTVELVPGRGSRGKSQDQVLRFAEQAAKRGLVHALSVTDNPGGHPTLAPDVIGVEFCRMGIEPIVHFTCKDKNRNQIESILYALDRLGVYNLLVMTGDYPLYGFQGKAKPVYDLDSVQLLRLIGRMNQGLDIDDRAPGGGIGGPPTHTLRGCAVSPFKQRESETLAQYFKLGKKVGEGADFVVTQVGFDARKLDELLRYMRLSGMDVPVLGNVYILNLPVAKVMNRKGVPGCVVTDKLYETCVEESRAADRGKKASLLRAAKMIAVLRGLGYDGAHIGGPNLRYEDVEWVIGTSIDLSAAWESLVPQFDYPMPSGFYLFEADPATGLNCDEYSPRMELPAKSPAHGIMRFFHRFAFAKGAPLYGAACSFSIVLTAAGWRSPLRRWSTGPSSPRPAAAGAATAHWPKWPSSALNHSVPSFSSTDNAADRRRAGAKSSPGRDAASLCVPTTVLKPTEKRGPSRENTSAHATGHSTRPPRGPTIFSAGTTGNRHATDVP